MISRFINFICFYISKITTIGGCLLWVLILLGLIVAGIIFAINEIKQRPREFVNIVLLCLLFACVYLPISGFIENRSKQYSKKQNHPDSE